jgi:hypothetical protein
MTALVGLGGFGVSRMLIPHAKSSETSGQSKAKLPRYVPSEPDLTAAQNDMRSAETALEAAHNRLRILGRSEDQISAFQQTRQMSADTPIYSPIAGLQIWLRHVVVAALRHHFALHGVPVADPPLTWLGCLEHRAVPFS